MAGAWAASPLVVCGQDDNQAKPDPVLLSWGKLEDVDYCSGCHLQPKPSLSGTSDTSFSRQDETKFWIENDKHCIARRRVEPLSVDELIEEADRLRGKLGIEAVPRDWFGASNVLSRRICNKLKYDVKTDAGYGKFRDNCLTCHGGYRGAADDAKFALDGDAQPGISCNYCHQTDGHKMVKGDWSQQHTDTRSSEWRLAPPEEKSKAGMRDLVTITTQASLCFDCHVGNLKENKFVTHEMYAAGHPPLPSIELETFCGEMPQHWRSPAQLYESLSEFENRDQYFATNYPGLKQNPKDVFWNTRKMVIGMLTARKKALEMYIDASSSGHWANYSLYDCSACHHELESTSQRQLRGFPGAPGRPRQAEWPVVLFNRLAGEGKLFKELEGDFTRRLTDQPFGNSAEVVGVAEQLHERLTVTLDRIEVTPFTSRDRADPAQETRQHFDGRSLDLRRGSNRRVGNANDCQGIATSQ